MERVKEFINNKLSELKFKGKYLEELCETYNLDTTAFVVESDKLETEIKDYTNVISFINKLSIEKIEKQDEPKTVYKDTNEIGWKCFVTRKRLGETQGEFAKRFGVDTTAVSKWELGKAKPNMKHHSKIEELFEKVKGE